MKKKLVFKKHELKKVDLDAYSLIPIELKDYLNWEPKRIYYITNTKELSKTGAHSHLKEEELFVMIKGTCVAVINQGEGLEEHKLEGPNVAIYVGGYVWHHFKDFSKDAVLLAISSTNYNPDRSDYVEDYDKYLELIK